jgi:thiamine biosynthesis lipoprotein
MQATTSRRRLIRILAAAAGLGLAGRAAGTPAEASPLTTWRGIAMGNLTRIDLRYPDPARAGRIVAAAAREIERLEMGFTLYRPDSALARLNRDARLADPPLDLVRLLGEARSWSDLTGGAFDVSVQPLWRVYASHFMAPGAAAAGPSGDAVRRAAALVDFRRIEIEPGDIRLAQAGMALTLNGIAPGYMTDRIVELLKNEGLADVLVDLGEIRAAGSRGDGEPWRAGIRDPIGGERIVRHVPLADEAIATSAGHGFRFDAAGRFHHIFDPRSGGCPQAYASISVAAPTATVADVLATACHVLPLPAIAPVLRRSGASRAIVIDRTGDAQVIAA